MPHFADVHRTLRHVPVLILMAAAVLATVPTYGAVSEDVLSDQETLSATQWSASAYSHRAGGTVCWIFGEDGSLRVEVFLDNRGQPEAGENSGDPAAVDLAPLLTRTGDGWTLVLGPDDSGTLNAWDREWRNVPGGLAQLARLVTTALRDFPDRPADSSQVQSVDQPWRSGTIPRPKMLGPRPRQPESSEVWRFQLATLDLQESEPVDVPGFRRNMVARGRGTGGSGEILVLRWRADGQSGVLLNLRSSRRPGELVLQPVQLQGVPKPEPELFLPLWPLSQFFEIP